MNKIPWHIVWLATLVLFTIVLTVHAYEEDQYPTRCPFPRFDNGKAISPDDWILLDAQGVSTKVETPTHQVIATITIRLDSEGNLTIQQLSQFTNPNLFSAKNTIQEGLGKSGYVSSVIEGQFLKVTPVPFWTFRCGGRVWMQFEDINQKTQKA